MTHREPGQGWTTAVPAGWRSVTGGPAFWRGDPWHDPVRLVVEAQPGRPPAEALAALAAARSIRIAGPREGHRRWARRAGHTGDGALAVELAVAELDGGAVVAALVAPPGEMPALVDAVLLPALDAFVPGPPDPPRGVLADPVPEPAYWPTGGWRTATPESQGMDAARLGALLAEIRDRDLPVDSVTVVRHGHVVLDATFGAFAAGTLGATWATGRLHKLQSVTKTVVGMLLGIALADQPAGGVTVDTPFLDVAGDLPSVPRRPDAAMRAITLHDLVTMRTGIDWRESGHAYERGGTNDVMAMILTRDWTRYVLDRPVAEEPGARFVYDSGAAHLVSAAISALTGRPAHAFAAERLFRPLGITRAPWLCAPEGVASGGFGLLLDPLDLAKLGFLALHGGRWEGRPVVPADWLASSTTDHVGRPPQQYGHLWWLDRADGYAHMAGLHGQLAVVHPGADLVVVMTGHFPAAVDASAVQRWLVEEFVLPAVG
ncbi:MAG TPA: serine hydrolase [Miltoncostaea sp.]|nr:serine hydrolase [Miltoncostaea sp.]